MTGGLVIVLGNTGRNFGAGMTGGFAYVLDESRTFVDRYNHELVEIARVSTEHMEQYRSHLRSQVRAYVEATNSQWGQTILNDFESFVGQFWLVKPRQRAWGICWRHRDRVRSRNLEDLSRCPHRKTTTFSF